MNREYKSYIIPILTLIVGMILVVVSLIIALPNGAIKNSIDQSIVDYFYTHRNNVIEFIFYMITMLGEAYAYILVLLILYYVWDKKQSFRLMLLVFTSNIVNAVTKYGFNISRPDENLWYEKLSESSPGYPSGHAQVNTTFWGGLITLTKEKWMTFVGIIVAGLVSFSRILLRVHWFTDVIGGIGIALIIVTIFAMVLEPVEKYLQKLSMPMKLLHVMLLYVAYLIPTILIIRDSDVMMDELKFITLFTTVVLSYLVEERWVNFVSKPKSWVTGILRVLIGVTSFVVVYLGLKYLFQLIINASPWVPGTEITLDLIRYALLGPVLILLAPWMMKKLNL